ncbi:hypothetical protein AKO1_006224 [Acrasis kona]|uniref:Uncharacterized protein n=1 Tax=Acrasis kona TaxID=1008807 RepID=A0AAW2YKS2_9EUKA
MTKNDNNNVTPVASPVHSPEARKSSPSITKITKAKKMSPSPKRSTQTRNLFMRMITPTKRPKSTQRSSSKNLKKLLKINKNSDEKENDVLTSTAKDDVSSGIDTITERTEWTDTATDASYFGVQSDSDDDNEYSNDYEVDPDVINTFGFDVPQKRFLTPKKTNVKSKEKSLMGIIRSRSSKNILAKTPKADKEEEGNNSDGGLSVADKILKEWKGSRGTPL